MSHDSFGSIVPRQDDEVSLGRAEADTTGQASSSPPLPRGPCHCKGNSRAPRGPSFSVCFSVFWNSCCWSPAQPVPGPNLTVSGQPQSGTWRGGPARTARDAVPGTKDGGEDFLVLQ